MAKGYMESFVLGSARVRVLPTASRRWLSLSCFRVTLVAASRHNQHARGVRSHLWVEIRAHGFAICLTHLETV